jgi:hypothetical protein
VYTGIDWHTYSIPNTASGSHTYLQSSSTFAQLRGYFSSYEAMVCRSARHTHTLCRFLCTCSRIL